MIVAMEQTSEVVEKMKTRQQFQQQKHQNHKNVASMSLDVTRESVFRDGMFAMVSAIVLKVNIADTRAEKVTIICQIYLLTKLFVFSIRLIFYYKIRRGRGELSRTATNVQRKRISMPPRRKLFAYGEILRWYQTLC